MGRSLVVNSLSVFFPAYNEEGNIKATVLHAQAVLNKYRFAWEIIVVDDGSTDKTGEIAQSLAGESPKIKVIHQKNGGYGKSLRAGFAAARFDWVLYTDADGQFDFQEITKFLDLAERADAIWGYRQKRSDPFLRKIYGLIWRLVAGLFFKILPHDVNCGFKMIKKEALRAISPLRSTRGAVINVELAYKLHKTGYTLKEVSVSHYPRRLGHPTGASPLVALKSFYELYLLARDA